MLWVPQKGVLRVQHNAGSVGTLTPGTSVTTGASTNTKGTPAEIFSATNFASFWMTIIATGYGAGGVASDGAMDILIGAATEEVLIPNLLMGECGNVGDNTEGGFKRWDFPLYTPAGSRIAVQAAGRRTSTAFNVVMYLHGGNGSPPFRVGSKVTTYGMGTVPNGTAITPGANGAEGSWAQIAAATSEDHFAFLPSFQVTNDSIILNRVLSLEIGVGAATEESIGEWLFSAHANELVHGPMDSTPVFQDVPAGTRLSMRASNNATNSDSYNAVIHAVS